MNFKGSITVKAGKRAFELISENGLKSDDISVVAGAAGGPKWIILKNLDEAVFGEWLKDRKKELPLIGSSIGTWRFSCICCKNMISAFERFKEAYFKQSYKNDSSSKYISSESLKILEHFLGNYKEEVLSHPVFRLNIMTAKCKWPSSSHRKIFQLTGFTMSYLLNLIKRDLIGAQFNRALFHDKRHKPDFFNSDQFKIDNYELTTDNLFDALLGSGSIPIIMEGVNIGKNVYRDGGIIDYNMDLKYENCDGIVLFPHYSDRIIPGWLDKKLTKRIPHQETTDKMLLIAPSKKMIESLPGRKIPDRKDFIKMDDDTRIKAWEEVLEKSRIMYDDFLLLTGNKELLLNVTEKL